MRYRGLLGAFAAPLIALSLGCAGPVHELWPPEPGAPAHRIIVSLDAWHAVIAFPVSTQQSALGAQQYEEWGFAEQAWYLEGRQGVTGALRALLWPTDAVVEVGTHTRIWADRSPQPPVDRFTFHLSDEGYRRLRQHLRETIVAPLPIPTDGTVTFYRAARSYHLFHQCHQYAAQALREAGLPVSPFWAFTRGTFALQFRRAERIAAEPAEGN